MYYYIKSWSFLAGFSWPAVLSSTCYFAPPPIPTLLFSLPAHRSPRKLPPLLCISLRTSVNARVEQVNDKAQNALDMLEDTQWPIGAQVKLGAALIKLLIETACWTHDEQRGVVTAWDKGADRVGGRGRAEGVPIPQAAFLHNVVNKSKKSKQGNLYLAPEVFSKVGALPSGVVNCPCVRRFLSGWMCGSRTVLRRCSWQCEVNHCLGFSVEEIWPPEVTR